MAKMKKKLYGTKARPRLAVFRSLSNIHAQVIDDTQGKTLASATSLKEKKGGNIAAAKKVGQQIATKAKAAGVTKVIFDRGTSLYHGRVKALADAAREGGLLF